MKAKRLLSISFLFATLVQPAFAHTSCPPAGGFDCEEPIWIDPFFGDSDHPLLPGQYDPGADLKHFVCYVGCEMAAQAAYDECMASADPTMCDAVKTNARNQCRAECDQTSR